MRGPKSRHCRRRDARPQGTGVGPCDDDVVDSGVVDSGVVGVVGVTLVVPVHNAVLLLNVDATLDVDAVADTLFGSLQQQQLLLPKG